MYAVTGATGQLGRHVMADLVKTTPPASIIAAVRDPAKAAPLAAQGIQVREADYDRPETLEAAFQGVERLLLISSSAVGRRVTQHQAVIAAAKAAGVSVVLYTSLLHADRSAIGLAEEHRQTEAALRDSGLSVVLLRNGWYAENYLNGVSPAVTRGVLFGAAGDGRISTASRSDYAAAAAVALAGAETSGVYELAGDESWTLADLAEVISKAADKPVAYKDISEAAYREALIGAGLPEHVAEIVANADASAAKGALFDDSRTLSRLIGRPTITMTQMINAVLNG
ncbi:SDR family oxidoreductase [Caulobacter sp. S45]|uniref:SDR family oxidoreductase n=1 Tax=Caulobacter sp. S45 TaxID=1641861 RepID=UPI00131D8487|nr:SDR family oxidoreductase [Caulobacter sp. S45]